MSIHLNDVFVLDSYFDIQHKNDQVLFLDLQNSNWFRTNIEGYDLLSAFDGNNSVADVIKKFSEKRHFDAETLQPYFLPFIEKAVERKVLLAKNEKHEIINADYCSIPNELWIHLTNRCNLACPFCYSSSGFSGERSLDKDSILRFVSEIPIMERKRIVLSGGEPLVYQDLIPLVQELKSLGFKITLISNGTIGGEFYPELVKYLDTFQFSVDGTTEQINSITRGKNHLEVTIQNINYAHDLGMDNIVVSFTSNKFNIFDLPNMAKFCNKNHVNHIHVTRIIPSGRANESVNDLAPKPEDFEANVKQLANNILEINDLSAFKSQIVEVDFDELKKRKYLSFSISSDPVRKLTEQTKITTCSLANGTLSINYDGYLYPCGCLSVDNLRIGHISEGIDNIMEKGKKLCSHFNVDNPEMQDCFYCEYKYICGGGCRACARSLGNMQGKDFFCDYYISRIKEVMWCSPGYYLL